MLRKVKISLAVMAALASMNAHALSIGEVSVKSAIGEPFLGTVKSKTECLTILPTEGDGPSITGTATMIKKGVFELRSNMPVSEPIVSITLKAGCHGEPVVNREYALMIDAKQADEGSEPVPQAIDITNQTASKADGKKKPKTVAKRKPAEVKEAATVAGGQASPSLTSQLKELQDLNEFYKRENDALSKRLDNTAKEVDSLRKSMLSSGMKVPESQLKPATQVAQLPPSKSPADKSLGDVKATVPLLDATVVAAPTDASKGPANLPVAEPVVEAVAPTVAVDMPSTNQKPEVEQDTSFTNAGAEPEVVAPDAVEPPAEEVAPPAPAKVETPPPAPAPVAQDTGIMGFIKANPIPTGGTVLLLLSGIAFAVRSKMNRRKKESWITQETAFASEVEDDGGIDMDLDVEDAAPTTTRATKPSSVFKLSSVDDEASPSVILNGSEMSDFSVSDPNSIFSWNRDEDDADRPAMTVILEGENEKGK